MQGAVVHHFAAALTAVLKMVQRSWPRVEVGTTGGAPRIENEKSRLHSDAMGPPTVGREPFRPTALSAARGARQEGGRRWWRASGRGLLASHPPRKRGLHLRGVRTATEFMAKAAPEARLC